MVKQLLIDLFFKTKLDKVAFGFRLGKVVKIRFFLQLCIRLHLSHTLSQCQHYIFNFSQHKNELNLKKQMHKYRKSIQKLIYTFLLKIALKPSK